jgi:hypothetical protein
MVAVSCTHPAGPQDGNVRGVPAVRIAQTLALLTAACILFRVREAVWQTSLKNAWRGMSAGILAWTIVWLFDAVLSSPAPATADVLWYCVAVLLLCPPIFVLGARRPVARVWGWFVVLPLVLVFAGPAVVAWTAGRGFPVLELELPVTIAYALVTFMGAGNYVGTRYTLAAVCYAVSLLLLAASVSEITPAWLPSDQACRGWATILVGAAFGEAWRTSRRRPALNSRFDRVWRDFRNWFGIVWARRVQVRVNEAAASQNWPVHLELHGFAARAGSEKAALTTEQAAPQIEHTLRWLLRRFVDDDWIGRRLAGD